MKWGLNPRKEPAKWILGGRAKGKGKACVEALTLAACLAREEARTGEPWKEEVREMAGARAGMAVWFKFILNGNRKP